MEDEDEHCPCCHKVVESAIDDAGLPKPTKNCTLRELMIHAGNRLADEKIVKLNKSAGQTKDDIIVQVQAY